jgi:hypothetical protein
MARKTLLTESEVRQFMKLANLKPLQEMGGLGYGPGMRDEEEEEEIPGMRDDYMQEAEEEEMEMDAEAPAPEGDMEMDMDAEMGEEPVGDMEMDMGAPDEMDDMGAEGSKEEQFADIVDKLADLLGLDADVEVGGDEEMQMGGEVDADEGGDLEVDAAPVGDDEDLGVELDDEEMGEEELVQEVARRVAARLLREKKQGVMANKLAERIFRRLTSK